MTVVTPSMARGIQVTPRLPDFTFADADVPEAWFDGDVGRSAVWSALSIIAGVGESGFIDAGRWLVARIDDPSVADETQRFVQQEAFHATVHARFNRVLAERGLPAEAVRGFVADLLEGIERFGGRPAFLAATLAGEQVLGEVGHAALDRPATFDGMSAPVRGMWLWHLFEEVEHQAALHDGWTHVHGKSPTARNLRLLGAAYVLLLLVAAWPAASWAMVPPAQRGLRLRPSTWSGVVRQLFGQEGLLRGAAGNLRALARVDFHPFDMHDPVPALARMRERLVEPAWERPVRPAPRVEEVEVLPVPEVDAGAIFGLVRYAAFVVRRTVGFQLTGR